MPVITVPRGIRDLNAEWLTAALAGVADGARVTDLVATSIGLGSIADSVRLTPSWDRPTPAPPSVVAKVPSSDPTSRATGFATRTYEIEAAFYAELADTVHVNRPTCYLARFDAEREAYVVLLEDLAPAEPGDQVEGCSPDDAASVMPELAALHAPRWGDPALLDISWLDRPGPEPARATTAFVHGLYPAFVNRYRDRLGPGVLELTGTLMASLERYLAQREPPWTVVHGDFRLDNVLFGQPRVSVVDWQTVRLGPGLCDVAYFIGSGLLPEDRRLHEVDLVRSYHTRLGDAGVDLAWEDCWACYRRYSFDGLLMGIAASMLVGRSERTDDMFMAMVNRHAEQAVDLGSAELIAGL
ncbi:MAG: phosphotransferase [Acidimicrobiales bacterium]